MPRHQPSAILLLACWLVTSWLPLMAAQAPEEPSEAIISEEQLQALLQPAHPTPDRPELAGQLRLGGINLLRLMIEGGVLMIPIGVMSLLVVAVSLERWFALRRPPLPQTPTTGDSPSGRGRGAVSPTELYSAAERSPSAAGRVLRDLLGKVGRPIAEGETAIGECIQREADRLYGNVRWLTLAAAVTPLIGLLGTVWGMIIAFYNTTQLTGGVNRAEYLAEGIYVALVTTLAGLAVAIPAAILAHYFEGQITKNLSLVDVELRRLTPRLEPFEGRTRIEISSRGVTLRPLVVAEPPPAQAQPSLGP